jgi:putative membrane protein
MKRTRIIKEAFLLASFVTTIFLLASCGYSQKPADTKNTAEEQNEERFNNNKQQKDAQFLVNAAENDLKQIQLGQLAQQKGNTAQVKELGRMMEEAHTKSLNDLTALARNKTITIPTAPTNDARDDYKDLSEKSENDFDEAYYYLMVSEHKDAIDTFEKASADSQDSDIRNWATVSLPGMRTHLDHSINYQERYNNN